MNIKGIEVTWLGHATFLLATPEGKTVLVDPWLKSSPVCPEKYHDLKPDAILVTHGHNDHTGDLVAVATASEAPVVGIFELATYFGAKGCNTIGMGKGGRLRVDAAQIDVYMTDASHSSAFIEEDGTIQYLGEPAGFVVEFSNGAKLYFAGDTCLFGDMTLIKKLWNPDVAVLPIGDLYTMDPRQAALAAEMLGVDTVIPCHFGTFPGLTGTPEQLEGELAEIGATIQVVVLPIGE